MTDKQLARLVGQAQKGDAKAFADIYTLFGRSAYYIGLRLNKNEHDANDVVQETMLRLYENLDKLKNNSAIKAFINRTAYNCSIDILRANKAEVVSEPEIIENSSPLEEEFIPEEYLESEEQRNYVIKTIDELNEVQRSAILMYYYENLSVNDIANIMEVSDDVVKSRLYRARDTLKKKLSINTLREVVILAIASPVLAKILDMDAKASFDAATRLTSWEAIGTKLGYSAEALSSTMESVGSGTLSFNSSSGLLAKTAAKLAISKGKITAVILAGAITASAGYGYKVISANNDSSTKESSIIKNPQSTYQSFIDQETSNVPAQPPSAGAEEPDDIDATATQSSEILTENKSNYIINKDNYILTYKKGTALSEEQILEDAKITLSSPATLSLDYLDSVDTGKVGEYAVYVQVKAFEYLTFNEALSGNLTTTNISGAATFDLYYQIDHYTLSGDLEIELPVNDKYPTKDNSITLEELAAQINLNTVNSNSGLVKTRSLPNVPAMKITSSNFSQSMFETLTPGKLVTLAVEWGNGDKDSLDVMVKVSDTIAPTVQNMDNQRRVIRFAQQWEEPETEEEFKAFLSNLNIAITDNYEGSIPMEITYLDGKGYSGINWSAVGEYAFFISGKDTSGNEVKKAGLLYIFDESKGSGGGDDSKGPGKGSDTNTPLPGDGGDNSNNGNIGSGNYLDDKGNLVDNKGNKLVDFKEIPEGSYLTKDGVLIDANGKPINLNGNAGGKLPSTGAIIGTSFGLVLVILLITFLIVLKRKKAKKSEI